MTTHFPGPGPDDIGGLVNEWNKPLSYLGRRNSSYQFAVVTYRVSKIQKTDAKEENPGPLNHSAYTVVALYRSDCPTQHLYLELQPIHGTETR